MAVEALAPGSPERGEAEAMVRRLTPPVLDKTSAKLAKQKERERAVRALSTLESRIASLNARVSGCRGLDPATSEEIAMVLEQASMVVEAGEGSLAQEVLMLLDAYEVTLNEACPK